MYLFKGAMLGLDQLLLLAPGHLEVGRPLEPEMQLHFAQR